MALPFDSPGHLERRIAARMAADVSSDSSLGITRKVSSMASTTFSTDDESYFPDEENQRSAMLELPRGNARFVDLNGGKYDPLRESDLANSSVQSSPLHRSSLAKAASASAAHNTSLHASDFSDVPSPHGPLLRSHLANSNPRPVNRTHSLQRSAMADTSSGFRSQILRERFEASVEGDESVSDAIIKRKPERRLPSANALRLPRSSSIIDDDDDDDAPTIVSPRQNAPSSSSSATATARRTVQLRSEDTVRSSPAPRVASSPVNGNNTPKASKMDRERMKAYVLSSVRAPNPLREQQLRTMTPRAPRRPVLLSSQASFDATSLPAHMLRELDRNSGGSSTSSYVSENSSTNDLTMPANMALRANSSLPDVGASEAVNTTRIDPVRLQSHLKKMNDLLDEENVGLREQVEELESNLERAHLDYDRKCKQLDQLQQQQLAGSSFRQEMAQSTTPLGSPVLTRADDEIEQLHREADDLRAELDEKDSALAQMEEELRIGAQRDDLHDRIADLELALEQERRDRKDDDDHYNLALEAAEADRERLKRQLQEERATSRAEIDRLNREARQHSTAEAESTPTRKEDLHEQIRQKNDRLDDYSVDLREARLRLEEYEEAQAKWSADQDDLQMLDEKCQALEDEVANKDDLLDDLKEVLERARDDMMNLQIALEEKESERVTMEAKLTMAKSPAEVMQLQEKVAKLDRELSSAREQAARNALRTSHGAAAAVAAAVATPSMVHPSVAALRKPVETPRSPPQLRELSDASWMHSQLNNDGEQALRRDLSALRHEYDAAREQVDHHLDKLDGAKMLKKMVEQQEEIDGLIKQLHSQRREVLNDVASLEADLSRVREESRRFGHDLSVMRRERGQALRRSVNELQSGPSVSKDEAAAALDRLRAEFDQQMVEAINEHAQQDGKVAAEHQAQCRGLLLQIRYEQAKFMRESDLRADLVHQKTYLMELVGGMHLNEKATARFLADLQLSRGHAKPVSNTKERRREAARARFKAVGWAVLAVCRAQIMARNWRATTDVRRAIRQAHQTAKKARLSSSDA